MIYQEQIKIVINFY